jgi:hypothetical protein
MFDVSPDKTFVRVLLLVFDTKKELTGWTEFHEKAMKRGSDLKTGGATTYQGDNPMVILTARSKP